jgi:hypothetical protein
MEVTEHHRLGAKPIRKSDRPASFQKSELVSLLMIYNLRESSTGKLSSLHHAWLTYESPNDEILARHGLKRDQKEINERICISGEHRVRLGGAVRDLTA